MTRPDREVGRTGSAMPDSTRPRYHPSEPRNRPERVPPWRACRGSASYSERSWFSSPRRSRTRLRRQLIRFARSTAASRRGRESCGFPVRARRAPRRSAASTGRGARPSRRGRSF